MENERRRDRVWKVMLNQFRRTGELQLSDIDVSLETRVDSYSEAHNLIDEENYRSEDDIREDPGGEGYIVQLEPDASDSTKRHVLKTAAGDRFQIAEKDEGRDATWVTGPHLAYLFGEREDSPIDDPLNTEFEVSWLETEDFEMYSERRRDRLWFQAINLAAQDKTLSTSDLDTSMTLVTADDRYSTALRLVEQESYRQETDITERDDKYAVAAEPDVSLSTKLTLVRTLAKPRYGLLTDQGTYEGWEPGPWARAIFNLEVDADHVASKKARELTDQVLADTSLEPDEQISTIKSLLTDS